MEHALTLDDLLRGYGRDDVLALVQNAGLRVVGGRFQCPFTGCQGHRADRPANVSAFMGKDSHVHLKCHRCEGGGRYVDLLMAVKGLTLAEAIEELKGRVAAAPVPRLRVVPSAPVEDPARLKPQDVERLWAKCVAQDALGEAYLQKRGLVEAPEMGLVRFVPETHPDGALARGAREGRRIGMLLKDVTGAARGMQIRLAREQMSTDRAKVLTLKGSTMAGAFFGTPELVESSSVVAVTEGMADTLAVAQWVRGRDVAVVGSPGKNNLSRLAEELERVGISVEGRVFVLFPQNDRPVNASRREFDRLSKLLHARGASLAWVGTPDEHKDVAAWFQSSEAPQWPPVAVSRALGLSPEEEERPEARMVPSSNGVVPLPARVVVDTHGQDFGTLVSLLDDPAARAGIMHRAGEWEFNEMSQRPSYARKDISATDWSAIRLGLESAGRTAQGKPLKWTVSDIQEAVTMLARRQAFHPVREWLNGLKWDGVSRLETDLPRALCVEEFSFEAALLRRWAISAVARVMKPGCKVDTVLVLVGPQGTGKSTFFSIMGGAWFTDQSIDVSDKDGRMVIHSAWVVEWAELDAMRRARDAEATKAFLSQRVDRFRPPYGRDLIEAPRSCVIVGTTNHEDFLSDATGNRRFWPVKVDRPVDLHRVAELREQLWAEAMAAYVAGETWHLDQALAEAARQHEQGFLERDAWEPLVGEWCRNRDSARTSDVLQDAIGKPAGQWTRGDEMRAGKILVGLGYTRHRVRLAAEGGRPCWVYRRSLTE